MELEDLITFVVNAKEASKDRKESYMVVEIVDKEKKFNDIGTIELKDGSYFKLLGYQGNICHLLYHKKPRDIPYLKLVKG